jgi:hypothetical protein
MSNYMVGDGYPSQGLDRIRVNTSGWPSDKGNAKVGLNLELG